MRSFILFVLSILCISAGAQTFQPRAALCINPSGAWIPVNASTIVGAATQSYQPINLFGENTNGNWYGLACDASGNLIYAGGGPPTGAAGGDLNGTYPNPGVAKVNGGTVPASANVLGSNGSGQIVSAVSSAIQAAIGASVYDANGAAAAAQTAAQAASLPLAGGTIGSTGLTVQTPPVIGSTVNFVFDGDSRMCGTNATYAPACTSEPYTIPLGGFIVSTTGSPSWGSTSLTVANGASTVNGMNVVGAGIAPGTTISSGGGTNSLTLSAAATATESNVAIKFGATDPASQMMQSPVIAATAHGYDLGISGQTCTQILARYATDAHTYSPAVTGNPGYFVLNCGTNDEGPTSTPTATGTNGQPSIVVSAVTGIDIGTPVTGTGIGTNAVVANTWNGTSTTIPLTVVNSGTVSGTMTFTTSASVISNVTAAIWALAKADGYKVVATTNPNHATTSATRNLNTAYNATIQQGKGNAYDYLADLKGKLNNTYNYSYWSSSDQTHFTNLGYSVWAASMIGAIIDSNSDFMAMPVAPLVTVPGTGPNNYAAQDTDLYSLTTGQGDTVVGYGSAPLATTSSYSAVLGDNDLTGCTTCTNNVVFGHGIGNNLATAGGSNVLLGGDTSTDSSYGISVGIGCSVTGASGVCIGHNATAAASAFALGGGATASASGAVEIDPVNANTNSVAGSFKYQALPMADVTQIVAGSVTGCGTVTQPQGAYPAFSFKAGQTSCVPVITLGVTAPHGFACSAADIGTNTDTLKQTATSTTTVTFTGTVVSADQLLFNCAAF